MHHIFLPHHHQTHRNVLIQMEAKCMKSSLSRAWECKPFTHGFLIFQLIELMYIGEQSHTSYTQDWASNILIKVQEPLQQVHHQHESVGEWRRRNERIGRYMRI